MLLTGITWTGNRMGLDSIARYMHHTLDHLRLLVFFQENAALPTFQDSSWTCEGYAISFHCVGRGMGLKNFSTCSAGFLTLILGSYLEHLLLYLCTEMIFYLGRAFGKPPSPRCGSATQFMNIVCLGRIPVTVTMDQRSSLKIKARFVNRTAHQAP